MSLQNGVLFLMKSKEIPLIERCTQDFQIINLKYAYIYKKCHQILLKNVSKSMKLKRKTSSKINQFFMEILISRKNQLITIFLLPMNQKYCLKQVKFIHFIDLDDKLNRAGSSVLFKIWKSVLKLIKEVKRVLLGLSFISTRS